MEAYVEDFLTGMLDDCTHLMERWRRRHASGQDWVLARLACWEAVANALPLNSGAFLELDPERFRIMCAEARALALLQGAGPTDPKAMPALVERLYAALAGPGDPAKPFPGSAGRRAVSAWAARHASPPGLPQSAMALVDFVQIAPLAASNQPVAALLASVLPTWAGAPMVHVLPPDGRSEEGFVHALEAACDGEDGAWIAYYLGRARRALKRMPALLEGAEAILGRWSGLLQPALGEVAGARLAAHLLAQPVIAPELLADGAWPADVLAEALVPLIGSEETVPLRLPDQTATILAAPLRLLAA